MAGSLGRWPPPRARFCLRSSWKFRGLLPGGVVTLEYPPAHLVSSNLAFQSVWGSQTPPPRTSDWLLRGIQSYGPPSLESEM
eukprot:194751-Prorocentrum_minimum.AAC.7